MQKHFNRSSALLNRPFLVALLLAALAFALFSPAINYDFVNYDDDVYVYENPVVLHGLNAHGIGYAFTTRDNMMWTPMTWLSLELDSSLFGTRPRFYHLTNIVLHAAAGAILFLALNLMLKSLWSSLLVAGIFLLHPLRTESVVWITERKDVLSAFFWALGLLMYWFYVNRKTWLRWALVLLCFILGTMSKMMMVTFPFVRLLLDLWPLNRVASFPFSLNLKEAGAGWPRFSDYWPLIREKIPFFILCAVFVSLNVTALHSIDTPDPGGLDVATRVLRVLENFAFYIGKIFWPVNLSVLYPIQKVQAFQAMRGAVVLILISGVAIWRIRKNPWLIVGWLWFFGTILPVIGFFSAGHAYVYDRFTYIPSIGLMLAVVVEIEHVVSRFTLVRWAGLVAVLSLCALGLRGELPRWRNSITLFDASLKVGPHYVAFGNLGSMYLKSGERELAMADFDRAIQLKPDYAVALSNRGSLWLDLGNSEQAIKDCSRAIESKPGYSKAWNNRGNAYNRRGDFAKALDDYNESIKLKPDTAIYYNNRAAVYFALKQYTQAKLDLDKCSLLGGKPNPALVRDLVQAMEPAKPDK